MRVRTLAFVTLFAASGCSFPPPPNIDSDADPDRADARPVDASIDAFVPDAAECTVTTCENNVLRECVEGHVERVQECSLGCMSQERCNWLEPSNGLGSQFVAASTEGDVVVPSGATIDSDQGSVMAGGSQLAIATTTIAQTGAPAIRVFRARGFTLNDVRITGSLSVAFVAIDDVEVAGIIDVSADGATGGPGALTCSTGAGGDESGGAWSTKKPDDPTPGQYCWRAPGGGGGGFGTSGALGGTLTGSDNTPGSAGVANGTANLAPLRGGCPGGGSAQFPGAGGGAVQIVSAGGTVRFVGGGAIAGINAGGGGGQGGVGCGVLNDANNLHSTGGGGSGGGILVEAGRVELGAAAVLQTGGGGGGGGGACTSARNGQDAPPNGGTAAGAACPAESWGTPPPGGAGAAANAAAVGGATDYRVAGAGGGGRGRVRINTADGTYASDPSAVVRGEVTTGTVALQ